MQNVDYILQNNLAPLKDAARRDLDGEQSGKGERSGAWQDVVTQGLLELIASDAENPASTLLMLNAELGRKALALRQAARLVPYLLTLGRSLRSDHALAAAPVVPKRIGALCAELQAARLFALQPVALIADGRPPISKADIAETSSKLYERLSASALNILGADALRARCAGQPRRQADRPSPDHVVDVRHRRRCQRNPAHLEAQHANQNPMDHGGLAASLADIILGRAAMAASTPRRGCLTANLSIDYLDSAPLGGWLEGCAVIERAGRSLSFASCRLLANGKPVATGRTVLKLLPPAARPNA